MHKISYYDDSLDNLPGTALVVDDRRGLLEIRDPSYNLVIWDRDEDPDIIEFFSKVRPARIVPTGDDEVFCKKVSSLVVPNERSLLTFLLGSQVVAGREAFLDEHTRLLDIMRRLQSGNRSYLSVMESEVKNYAFHDDDGYTLNWTLLGPGGLWVREEDIDAIKRSTYMSPKPGYALKQFPESAVVLYKGNPPGHLPLIHSRPDRPQGVRRAVHQIYL